MATKASVAGVETCSLTAIARDLATTYRDRSGLEHRRARGQVFTPPEIARFMAGLLVSIPRTFRLLDPGAGTGLLTAAACERVCSLRSPRQVQATLVENDVTIVPLLEETVDQCDKALRKHGHRLECEIVTDDFLTHVSRRTSQKNLFDDDPTADLYDAIIANPPYFKIRAESRHAKLLPGVIHGQPNIYALFLAGAAEFLRPGGQLVAITPRSFCNGLYFREFRRWFFRRMSLSRVHLFESRTEAFKEANILQESVVTRCERLGEHAASVTITRSHGRDLRGDLDTEELPATFVLDRSGPDCCLRIPETSADTHILREIERWPHRFSELGLRISTGPVVTFRTTKYLRNDLDAKSVPLLSVHNVRPFRTIWPIEKNGKPLAFHVCEASRKHLTPVGNYVLIRRFSAKEERRRLTASCYLEASEGTYVALENHLNYVYHRSRPLTEDEVFGIAALFNSALLDRYFRAMSGNTQVNATEVRTMRFPDLPTLARIGERLRRLADPSLQSTEEVVLDELSIDGAVKSRLKGLVS